MAKNFKVNVERLEQDIISLQKMADKAYENMKANSVEVVGADTVAYSQAVDEYTFYCNKITTIEIALNSLGLVWTGNEIIAR